VVVTWAILIALVVIAATLISIDANIAAIRRNTRR
jgi:hypothetical protein